jgi:hypothetical protein
LIDAFFDRTRPFFFLFFSYFLYSLSPDRVFSVSGDRFLSTKKAIVAVTIAQGQKKFDLPIRNEEDRRWVANYLKFLAHPGRGRLLFPVRDGRSKREYLAVNLGLDRNNYQKIVDIDDNHGGR